jgi:drug/metabolite transporter (DMT)-like permease
LALDPWLVGFHAINQGLLNMVVATALWGLATTLKGPGFVARFPPIFPVLGTLIAIPVLGEWPGPPQTLAIALIVTGLTLAAWPQQKRS